MQRNGLTQLQQDVIYDWIDSVLSSHEVEISWGYPDEPAENKPFCILTVVSQPRPSSKPAQKYASTDTISHLFHNDFTLSVKIYDIDGNDYIRKIIKSQYYETNIERLKTQFLVCRYDISTYFLPEFDNDKYEYREGVDFQMGFGESDDEIVGEIKEVEVEGTLSGTKDGNDIVRNYSIK